MSISIQQGVNGSARNGPVPGLGIGLGEDQAFSTPDGARDFASVMRDLAAPAEREAASADESGQEPIKADRSRKSAEKKIGKRDDASVADSPDSGKPIAAAEVAPVAASATTPVAGRAETTPSKDKAATAIAPAESTPAHSRLKAAEVPGLQGQEAVEDKEATSVPVSPAMATDAKTLKQNNNNIIQNIDKKENIKQNGKVEESAVLAVATKEKTDAPVKPGEATALLSMAGEKGKASSADAKGQPVVPVRGEGLVTPKGKPIEGLLNAANHAAPQSAVVKRVAEAQVAARTGETTTDQTSGPVPEEASEAAPVAVVPASASATDPVRVSTLALAAAQLATQEGEGTEAETASGDAAAVPTFEPDSDGKAALREVHKTEGAPILSRFDALSRLDVALSAPLQGLSATAASAAPALNLAGALDQQVLDLGVSGQWIEDIARTIASVAANPGQGSFRLASEALGAVRVDITPGTRGSDVVMTVDNDAAHAALAQDRQRLVQDAQLASVRLGDVRIDRIAPMADAHRGDMGNGGQQGNGNNQSAAQAALTQNGGHNGNREASAQAGQQNGGNSPKGTFTRTVLNDAASNEAAEQGQGRRSDRARYA